MTTEQALRDALEEITKLLAHRPDNKTAKQIREDDIQASWERACAVLTLPVTEVTLEYRVKYEAEDYCGQWVEKVRNCHKDNVVSFAEDARKEYPYRCRNSRIESRDVFAGPWLPVVQP